MTHLRPRSRLHFLVSFSAAQILFSRHNYRTHIHLSRNEKTNRGNMHSLKNKISREHPFRYSESHPAFASFIVIVQGGTDGTEREGKGGKKTRY